MQPVALVTGASRGIGRGIARELAKLGYDLVLGFVRDAAAAQAAAAECVGQAAETGRSIRAETCQADIASSVDRELLLAFTRARFGRLDLLVNNAGIAPEVRADLLEATEDSFDRVVAVNVKGPFFLTQVAARWMIDQAAAAGAPGAARAYRPKIVTVTSISAYAASVTRGDYCLAKAALTMLTPLFAARLADHGICVYEVRPGIIATDMTRPVAEKYDRLIAEGLTPQRRWGTPEDVGKAVAAIAMDLFPFSTGAVLDVDGGFQVRRL